MPYDPVMTKPFREEVTRLGVRELTTPQDVDAALAGAEGTVLVFVNSVCGCAGGAARPGLALALKNRNKPDSIVTVFAGQDVDAVAHIRQNYFTGQPPSSPCFGLFKDGKLVQMIHRHQIEGQHPASVAKLLTDAFDKYCAKDALPSN